MNRVKLQTIFKMAPIREFENGPKLRGYFLKELKAAGIEKSAIKSLVNTGVLKLGRVHLKQGTQNFYTLNEIKKAALPGD